MKQPAQRVAPRAPKPRVLVRLPGLTDGPMFLEAVYRSRSLHRGWVSPPDTAEKFKAYVERMASGSNYNFLVITLENEQLAGVINLNNVIRGFLQSAFLGYYVFTPFEEQGLMGEGLRLVIRYAFTVLKLHRLEANVQPGNLRSSALARKCGLVQEGFSRRYLKVAGHWRDHERWAILRD
jgi:ribosomal-protein-alanine N-acetyltransferase